MKILKNTKCLFIVCLTTGILGLLIYMVTYPQLLDEAFYASVPYRLVNGDSLIHQEWHLTQFSSFFSYIPVYIWLMIKGSAEGIIVYLRVLYFIIHTITTVVIYRFFKKYEMWAVVASMLFFTQVPYRIFGISYHSVFVISVLFFTLCLLSIYEKKSKSLYIIAGVCFGCSCVCNPLCCLLFFLYLIVCVMWAKRNFFERLRIDGKFFYVSKQNKKISKKNKYKNKTRLSNIENYDCFFSKDAIIYSFIGIFIVAIFTFVFFLVTGGTVNSNFFEDIKNILKYSDYSFFSRSILFKVKELFSPFNRISLNAPFILPLLYIFLLLDNKKKTIIHRSIYLILALILSVWYIIGMLKDSGFSSLFFSLPFVIFSSVCYILTDKKNKILFRCMWVPSAIAAFFQTIATNTFLAPMGMVFTINNICGVIFVRDLFNEIEFTVKLKEKFQRDNNLKILSKCVLCLSICVQLIFHIFIIQYEQIPFTKVIKAASGPYSGIIMTEEQYENYKNTLSDIDFIKSLNTEDLPLLILSYKNWAYMYADCPIATYTTWFNGGYDKAPLISYYKSNYNKIPKYIYIDFYGFNDRFAPDISYYQIEMLSEDFEFTQKKLTNGILLFVDDVKFETKK